MRYWQDIQEGGSFRTGTLNVTREEILEFLAEFDPQPYHLDTEAADASFFGGLCASGWQVSGMGLQDLVWHRPVRPGHTITFTYEITAKPNHVFRDKWGIIRSRNEAFNQYNRPVMSFNIDILAERNPEIAISGTSN